MPDGHKIDQTFSKIYPNRYFWFENEPSGNPWSEDNKSLHRRRHKILLFVKKAFHERRGPILQNCLETWRNFTLCRKEAFPRTLLATFATIFLSYDNFFENDNM
jgi:hypothetical protein